MRNLAPERYVDAEGFLHERERIFATTWQLLGPESDLDGAGDYSAIEVAGMKLMAVRGRDGRLRAFRNVCRHRGARILEEGVGRCNVLRCPYHNWVYDLDGTLRQAPWFGEEAGFDTTEWPLEEVSVDTWRGLVFVAVDPRESLEEQLGATVGELADTPVETYAATDRAHLVFDANWKIYTDNFVEGYHIPGIHPGFFESIDFETFRTEAADNLVRMTASPRDGLFYTGRWYWMWPNWTLSLFDGGMNTSRINPIDENRTELFYTFYFADSSPATADARRETIERNLAVIREDFEVCIATHANYRTGGYTPGPLSPRHEQGVAWFQAKLTAATE